MPRLNLLLLLSALFAALTGAASTVREPTAAHAVAAAAAIQADVAREDRQAARRPLATVPDFRVVAVAGTDLALAAAAPLYASRRRE